jgi:hypothetical protein
MSVGACEVPTDADAGLFRCQGHEKSSAWVIDMSGGGDSNPTGVGLAPLQQKLRRVKRDDAWVQLERLPGGGHQIK